MNPAFNGDHFIELEIKALVTKWSIQTIIETGTYFGDSTRVLARFGPEVITIEMDWLRFTLGAELEKIHNVNRLHGDSAQILADILPAITHPILYYLDAHWAAHSPLLDELEQIACDQIGFRDSPPVIAIHDFFNPLHPEYCYDAWDIGEYRLELIISLLDRIYGHEKWCYHFNDQSRADPPRGIVYVEPVKL